MRTETPSDNYMRNCEHKGYKSTSGCRYESRQPVTSRWRFTSSRKKSPRTQRAGCRYESRQPVTSRRRFTSSRQESPVPNGRAAGKSHGSQSPKADKSPRTQTRHCGENSPPTLLAKLSHRIYAFNRQNKLNSFPRRREKLLKWDFPY
jgi:hypothetical protein